MCKYLYALDTSALQRTKIVLTTSKGKLMGDKTLLDTLVLDAMRLAERAHRTRQHGPHHRKAPEADGAPACGA
jgi:hypothetical protein